MRLEFQMAKRKQNGNMLAVVAATAILLIIVMFFGLSYLSMTRGHMENRSAAEAAALVVAQDIGRIVVNTPECGFVGLCDQPPVGLGTLAEDYYFVEVRSINELMATARLDYIIADLLGDDQMKQYALQEKQNILKAKDKLVDAIKDSLRPGGTALDSHYKQIKPYEDAEAIYLKNQAKGSTYVAGSLKLDLGCLDGGIATQIAIPNPTSRASVVPGETLNNCYVSEKNISYNGENFVFASTGKQVSLGDLSKYRDTIDGLPIQIPAVIKVEADQKFVEQGKEYTQHFAACASPGSDLQHPLGGALTLSFPDGPFPELTRPRDLFTWSEMQSKKCDVLTSEGGDFPVDTGALISPLSGQAPAWISSPPTAAAVCKLGVYDWLRAAGSRINIDSVLNMFSATADFNAPDPEKKLWRAINPFDLAEITLGEVPGGVAHIYTFNANGSVLYRSKAITPYPYLVAAHKQLYAECLDLKSKVAKWKLEGISFGVKQKAAAGASNQPIALSEFPLLTTSGREFKPFWLESDDDYEVGGKGGPSKGGPLKDGKFKGGGGTATFDLKTQDIEGDDKFDFYFRDMVRYRGADNGGFHQGEIMDSDLISHKLPALDDYEVGGKGGGGSGAPPIVSRQDDFASDSIPFPAYQGYSYGPDEGAPRPTYTKNGVAVDIRFRRQIKVGALSILLGGFDVGYIGEML